MRLVLSLIYKLEITGLNINFYISSTFSEIICSTSSILKKYIGNTKYQSIRKRGF